MVSTRRKESSVKRGASNEAVLELSSESSAAAGLEVANVESSINTPSQPDSSATASGTKGRQKLKRGGNMKKTVVIVAPPDKPKGGRKAKKTLKKLKTITIKKIDVISTPVVSNDVTTTRKYVRKQKTTKSIEETIAIPKKPIIESPILKLRAGARSGTRNYAVNAKTELFTGIDDIPRINALKKKLPPTANNNKTENRRQVRHMAVGEETTSINKFGETVIKVKLMTGILYIYRGGGTFATSGSSKRRAEFIRSK